MPAAAAFLRYAPAREQASSASDTHKAVAHCHEAEGEEEPEVLFLGCVEKPPLPPRVKAAKSQRNACYFVPTMLLNRPDFKDQGGRGFGNLCRYLFAAPGRV